MKAEILDQPEIPPYRPVTITLETRDEFIALYALVCSGRLCSVIPEIDSWYGQLQPLEQDLGVSSRTVSDLIDKINNLMK